MKKYKIIYWYLPFIRKITIKINENNEVNRSLTTSKFLTNGILPCIISGIFTLLIGLPFSYEYLLTTLSTK
jgi:hypothetical protein